MNGLNFPVMKSKHLQKNVGLQQQIPELTINVNFQEEKLKRRTGQFTGTFAK